MSKNDEKCLKLIDFGLSKNFLEQNPTLAAPKEEPKGTTKKRIPKNNMKTRAGTVTFCLTFSPSISHLKFLKGHMMRNVMSGLPVSSYISFFAATLLSMETQTRKSSSR
jgi:hypothetical protein